MSEMLRRAIRLQVVRAEDAGGGEKKNIVRVVASTDVAYDWGYYSEKLAHGENAIDREGAVSVLLNHDRNQIIGGIRKIETDGSRMTAELEIDPDVRGTNGLRVLDAVRNGYLAGVSIGYDYRREDCVIVEDENEKRTINVNRWRLMEISLTPTPADVAASVSRQMPEWIRTAAVQEDAPMGDKVKAPNGADGQEEKDEVAKEREALAKERKALDRERLEVKLRGLAQSHGVELSDQDLVEVRTEAQGLELLLSRKAKAQETKLKSSAAVDIGRDSADKADEAAEEALLSLAGVRTEKNKGMRAGSVLDIGRRWLAANGASGVLEMNRYDVADALIGNGGRMSRVQRQNKRGRRDAANVTSGLFTSYVMANVMDKQVYNGFQASEESCTHHIWTTPRQVADFKTFSGAALDYGNLVETTENVAFPELGKAEGGYSAALGMWGATISLTLQALINDDLGQFLATLAKAGMIARRTVDVKVYADLAAATWTNRTTAGALSDTTVSVNRGSIAGITGPAGQILGITPRYLIVPSALRGTALSIAQIAPYIAPSDVKVNTDLIPIITPFLASSTYWYLVASQIFEPVVVATLQGMEAPIVEEYDSGAVASRKWKIMYPFKVVIPTVGGNIAAMWQGTA